MTNATPAPTYSVERVTPEQARKWLDNSTARNRNLKPGTRKKYERAILMGEWKQTHQPIALDANENILDGQHRLQAIANTQAVEIVVARNCDPSTFNVIDCGTSRSASDVLQAGGRRKDASIVAASLKYYLQYQYYPDRWWSGAETRVSHAEVSDWSIQKSYSIDIYLPIIKDTYRPSKCFGRASALAFCYLAEDVGWRAAEIADYWNSVGTGANLTPDSVILSFRNQLANTTFRRRGVNAMQYQLNAMIKCFNDSKAGRTGKFTATSTPIMRSVVPRNKIIKPANEIMNIIRGRA